jgi:HSP20 family protein
MLTLLPTLRRSNWLRRPEWDLFDRFFEDFSTPNLYSEERTFTPAFDVSETEKELIIEAEIPGIKKEDISINLSNGLLSIKGEKKHETKEEKENYHCIERRYGTFKRNMQLPVEVDSDKVDATYKDGLLTITIPKAQAAEPKKIEVH